MFKCRMGTKLYACFKSEHIEKLKGSAVIFVSPRQCSVVVDINKKNSVVVEKRPLPEDGHTTTSETKRMKAALDKSTEENSRLHKDLLKLRTDPQLGNLQQIVVRLQFENAKLEAERREMMKEGTAMKSLLEQQGLGSGDDLNTLVKFVAMYREEGVEEKDGSGEKVKQTKWDVAKEEIAREAVEKKVEEKEEVAASSVKEGVEGEPKEGAEEFLKVFLSVLSAMMKKKK